MIMPKNGSPDPGQAFQTRPRWAIDITAISWLIFFSLWLGLVYPTSGDVSTTAEPLLFTLERTYNLRLIEDYGCYRTYRRKYRIPPLLYAEWHGIAYLKFPHTDVNTHKFEVAYARLEERILRFYGAYWQQLFRFHDHASAAHTPSSMDHLNKTLLAEFAEVLKSIKKEFNKETEEFTRENDADNQDDDQDDDEDPGNSSAKGVTTGQSEARGDPRKQDSAKEATKKHKSVPPVDKRLCENFWDPRYEYPNIPQGSTREVHCLVHVVKRLMRDLFSEGGEAGWLQLFDFMRDHRHIVHDSPQHPYHFENYKFQLELSLLYELCQWQSTLMDHIVFEAMYDQHVANRMHAISDEPLRDALVVGGGTNGLLAALEIFLAGLNSTLTDDRSSERILAQYNDMDPKWTMKARYVFCTLFEELLQTGFVRFIENLNDGNGDRHELQVMNKRYFENAIVRRWQEFEQYVERRGRYESASHMTGVEIPHYHLHQPPIFLLHYKFKFTRLVHPTSSGDRFKTVLVEVEDKKAPVQVPTQPADEAMELKTVRVTKGVLVPKGKGVDGLKERIEDATTESEDSKRQTDNPIPSVLFHGVEKTYVSGESSRVTQSLAASLHETGSPHTRHQDSSPQLSALQQGASRSETSLKRIPEDPMSQEEEQQPPPPPSSPGYPPSTKSAQGGQASPKSPVRRATSIKSAREWVPKELTVVFDVIVCAGGLPCSCRKLLIGAPIGVTKPKKYGVAVFSKSTTLQPRERWLVPHDRPEDYSPNYALLQPYLEEQNFHQLLQESACITAYPQKDRLLQKYANIVEQMCYGFKHSKPHPHENEFEYWEHTVDTRNPAVPASRTVHMFTFESERTFQIDAVTPDALLRLLQDLRLLKVYYSEVGPVIIPPDVWTREQVDRWISEQVKACNQLRRQVEKKWFAALINHLVEDKYPQLGKVYPLDSDPLAKAASQPGAASAAVSSLEAKDPQAHSPSAKALGKAPEFSPHLSQPRLIWMSEKGDPIARKLAPVTASGEDAEDHIFFDEYPVNTSTFTLIQFVTPDPIQTIIHREDGNDRTLLIFPAGDSLASAHFYSGSALATARMFIELAMRLLLGYNHSTMSITMLVGDLAVAAEHTQQSILEEGSKFVRVENDLRLQRKEAQVQIIELVNKQLMKEKPRLLEREYDFSVKLNVATDPLKWWMDEWLMHEEPKVKPVLLSNEQSGEGPPNDDGGDEGGGSQSQSARRGEEENKTQEIPVKKIDQKYEIAKRSRYATVENPKFVLEFVIRVPIDMGETSQGGKTPEEWVKATATATAEQQQGGDAGEQRRTFHLRPGEEKGKQKETAAQETAPVAAPPTSPILSMELKKDQFFVVTEKAMVAADGQIAIIEGASSWFGMARDTPIKTVYTLVTKRDSGEIRDSGDDGGDGNQGSAASGNDGDEFGDGGGLSENAQEARLRRKIINMPETETVRLRKYVSLQQAVIEETDYARKYYLLKRSELEWVKADDKLHKAAQERAEELVANTGAAAAQEASQQLFGYA